MFQTESPSWNVIDFVFREKRLCEIYIMDHIMNDGSSNSKVFSTRDIVPKLLKLEAQAFSGFSDRNKGHWESRQTLSLWLKVSGEYSATERRGK